MKTNEMMRGTDRRNYEDDWKVEDVLDLIDSTVDESIPIPKELFECVGEIRARAEGNRNREAAIAKDSYVCDCDKNYGKDCEYPDNYRAGGCK